jgi:dCMP deaminase
MNNNARRPSWDEYFMEMAVLVSQRSTCLRRHVGAVIVKEKRVLATGYNGAPSGLPHCLDVGCLRKELNVPSGQRHELCRAIHAEQNALVQAASFGASVRDAVIYSTTYPCSLCSKLLINAGIKEIIVKEGYPDEMSVEMLSAAKINVRLFDSKATDTKAPEEQKDGDS